MSDTKRESGDKEKKSLGSSGASLLFRNAESHVYKHLFLICSIPLTPGLILSHSLLSLFRPPLDFSSVCVCVCGGRLLVVWLGQNRV